MNSSTQMFVPAEDFPILTRTTHGKPLIYADSAATTQKPRQVISAMNRYLEQHCANVHRAVHTLGEESTQLYEAARGTIAQFIHSQPEEIIFTKGATEGINVVMRTWGHQEVHEDDEIILSIAEHHSNFVPWQILCRDKKAHLRIIPIHPSGVIDVEQLKNMLTKKTKIIALTHLSNVLGTEQPIRNVRKIINSMTFFAKHSPIIVIDAAQSIAHLPLDVHELGGDFVVFSAHKILGPPGVGVLWGKEELLRNLPPFLYGGDMVNRVTIEKTTFADHPHRFEAGTPNIVGAIGFAEAVRYLQKIGMQNIRAYTQSLGNLAYDELVKIPLVKVLSPRDNNGIITFFIKGLHPHDIAALLDEEGIAIRAGHHCAEPLHHRLGLEASCRASFYIYNTEHDVHALVKGIQHAIEVLHD